MHSESSKHKGPLSLSQVSTLCCVVLAALDSFKSWKEGPEEQSEFNHICGDSIWYCARAQDGPQEMERN